MRALLDLDPGAFVENQPQMGAFSLLLRWPLAALADDGDLVGEYRLGTLACLLVAMAIGLWLASWVERRHGPWPAAAVLALWLLAPPVLEAVDIGHPEEVLGGALCVAAVLAACRERPLAAGILLGLALATKQWALVAVPPVLLALAGGHVRAAVAAAAVWLPLELPLVLGDFEAYRRLGSFGVTIGVPSGIWWPLEPIVGDDVVQSAARPLVIGAALAVSAVAWRRYGPGLRERAFALLALVFLLRCVLDPTGNGYFHAPMLMALLAYEGLTRNRLPLVAGLGAAALAVIFDWMRHRSGLDAVTQSAYLTGAVALGWWLWLSLSRAHAPRASAAPTAE